MNPTFWKDRNILITGHTGFKGSWVTAWLNQLGANVTGLALDSVSDPNLFDLLKLDADITHVRADIRDPDRLRELVAQVEPDIVLHMAAQSLVRPSYDDPVGTYATNVMGTVNLLDAVRTNRGTRAVVNVTSDKCYENQEWHWGYRENDRFGGYDPYSNSKGCAELVTSAYRNSFFNPATYDVHGTAVASARAGNVIGGGDWATDRLVPDIMRAFSDGRPVVIRSPRSIRPWQHVLEPLRGYLTLAERLVEEGTAFADGWNFGPGDDDARSVSWVAEKLSSLWPGSSVEYPDNIEQPHEACYLKLDCSRANAVLNWSPVWDVDRGLEETVAWYQRFYNGEDPRSITEQQIEKYTNDYLDGCA